jgi:hypothetical protein
MLGYDWWAIEEQFECLYIGASPPLLCLRPTHQGSPFQALRTLKFYNTSLQGRDLWRRSRISRNGFEWLDP